MAKQIENVTNEEFDLLKSKGWIDDNGELTQAGKAAIFAGTPVPPDGIEYRRAGVPDGTAIAVPVERTK